jgi:hypothetical protein
VTGTKVAMIRGINKGEDELGHVLMHVEETISACPVRGSTYIMAESQVLFEHG